MRSERAVGGVKATNKSKIEETRLTQLNKNEIENE